MRIILSLLALLLLAVIELRAQAPLKPLGSLLNPDGTLNLESGFTGSLDPAGWQMSVGADGTPRFMASKSGASTLSVPGDEYWDDIFGPPGANGTVYAVAVRGTEVFIGGKFNAVGNVPANNFARWDATTRTWSQIGNGVGDAVYTIAVTAADIFIGGIFRDSESFGYVARYDALSDNFDFLGNRGVIGRGENVLNSPTAVVNAIAVYGDSVYVGGGFFQVDNIEVPGIALWNRKTDTWERVVGIRTPGAVQVLAVSGNSLYMGGAGGILRYEIPSRTLDSMQKGVKGSVRAIIVDGENVYVGGTFGRVGDTTTAGNVARWDGTHWYALGSGVSNTVNALTRIGDDLYAGGTFTQAGGIAVNYVARWNGAEWKTLDLGVAAENGAAIHALASDGKILYAGGTFTAAGSVTAHNIAGWDGEQWFPLIRNYDPELNRNGTSEAVFAIAVKGTELYVGGDFTKAGGVSASGVARYDITTGLWSPLGSGITGPSPFVRTIAVLGNDIYVGGTFQRAGGIATSGIARWNGSTWAAVGGGVGGTTPYVFALAVSGNDLFAAGAFTTAGGIPASRVARWDGTQWVALGSGLSADSGYVTVTAIVAGDDGIYAGGEFALAGSKRVNHIARFDGTEWSAVGNGLNAPVSALAWRNDTLYAGGEFTRSGVLPLRHIARWDGTRWDSLGAGTSAPVRTLGFDNDGSLLAGGEFITAGQVSAGRLARWTNSGWRVLGAATRNGANGPVRALAVTNDLLVIGGSFSVVGSRRTNNIAYFDGTSWSSLGSDPSVGLFGAVLALAVSGDTLYAGGLFSAAGGMSANAVARWDGNTWSRMGRGIQGPVRALVVGPSGEVYAGGEFLVAGGHPASGIAVWNGSDWQALGEGLGGPKPYAFTLAIDDNWLYAGGSFSTAGGVDASRIARWNLTTKQWSGLGSGVHGASYYTYITSLSARGSDLYAGGVFTRIGGVDANNVAHWDGTRWQAMGDGVNNAVYAVAASPTGTVYAGGDMSTANDTSTVHSIVQWNGSQWRPLGSGMSSDVLTLAVSSRGILFAGGLFVGAGTTSANHVAMWDGLDWQILGRGIDNDYSQGKVMALAVSGNSIWVGGDFTVAGGKPSFYIAKWSGAYLSVRMDADASAEGMVQTRPNPATSKARVEYSIAQPDHVRLSVYDLLGKEVAVIVEGALESGDHSATLDVTGLSAGVYLCRLQTSRATATSTIVVSH